MNKAELNIDIDFRVEISHHDNKEEIPPLEIFNEIRRSKNSSLFIWHDSERLKSGICIKEKCIILNSNNILNVTLSYLYSGKAPGWVLIEAVMKGENPNISLLQTIPYSEEAKQWFSRASLKIAHVFGCEFRTVDCGDDN